MLHLHLTSSPFIATGRMDDCLIALSCINCLVRWQTTGGHWRELNKLRKLIFKLVQWHNPQCGGRSRRRTFQGNKLVVENASTNVYYSTGSTVRCCSTVASGWRVRRGGKDESRLVMEKLSCITNVVVCVSCRCDNTAITHVFPSVSRDCRWRVEEERERKKSMKDDE